MGCLIGGCDKMEFDIFSMKEPDYNIMLMLTYSAFTMSGGQKE